MASGLVPSVGFPGGSVCKESDAGDLGDLRDLDSIPGVGEIPWRRKWQPTPGFLPGSPIDRGT